MVRNERSATRNVDIFVSYSHASDRDLAPALQRALTRLGKAWNRPRALRVFRDETNLAAASDLSAEIYRGLEQARYFLLLASPAAARSEWVGKEIEYWKQKNPSGSRFLIAVTDGVASWDATAGDFDWSQTDALPRSVSRYFTAEPHFVDLGWARGENRLTLGHDKFRSAVATLAAPVHGVTKDELDDENSRQHRIFTRVRTGAITALALLLVLAVIAGTVAVFQRDSAIAQRDLATTRQLIAESRNIAASDPALSRLLAVAATRLARGADRDEAESALRAAQLNPGVDVLTGHRDQIVALAYSPDGRTLASAGLDGALRVWDTARRKQRGEAIDLGDSTALGFSSDATTLAAATASGTVRLWDVNTGKPRGDAFDAHDDRISAVALNADGTVLATATLYGEIRLWDTTTHQQRGATINGALSPVYSLTIGPDGQTLAAGFEVGVAMLWNMADGTARGGPLRVGAQVYSVAIGPSHGSATLLATTSEDGTAQLWDAATGARVGDPLTGHTSSALSVAFSPDGATLATTSNDGSTQLWDTTTRTTRGAALSGHTGWIRSVVFTPDGSSLATGSADSTIRIWSLDTSRPRGKPLIGETNDMGSVTALNSDGTILATGSTESGVRLWDVATRTPHPSQLAAVSGYVDCLAYSPDDKWLAAGGYDGKLRLWKLGTPDPPTILTAHTSEINSIAFSPDSATLATAGKDGKVRLWNVATGAQRDGPLVEDRWAFKLVEFSPDGTRLATIGGRDGWTAQLWDLAGRSKIGDPLAARVGTIAFSPDGATVATAGSDHAVRFWDSSGHEHGTPLRGHTNTVKSVRFSPNGETLVTGADDATIRFWDAATHRAIGDPLTATRPGPRSILFSRTGTLLVTSIDTTFDMDSYLAGTWQGPIQLFELAVVSADSAGRVCDQAGRDLTRSERERYLPGQVELSVCP